MEKAKKVEFQNPLITCDCSDCVLRTLMFQYTSEEEALAICKSKIQKVVMKGETIVSQGEPIKNFFYIKDGLVKLYRQFQNEKDTQIICLALPYDYVSLLTVFHDSEYRYSMAALEDTTVCILPIDFVKNIIRNNGPLGMGFLEKSSLSTDRIINNYITINGRNLRGRIAFILLDFADRVYHRDFFELPVSRKEVAQLIGMTTENVIRILSEFRQEKIIRINGKEIEILDKKRLNMICEHG